MSFKKYWNGLSEEGQIRFAKRVGCSRSYVRNEYLSPDPLRRPQPSKKKLALMIEHSNSKLKLSSLLKYFFGEGVERLIAREKEKSPASGA